jgi:hypothetical protein
MLGLNKEEIKILKSLNTPRKIQDFLNKIPINFEEEGDTCMSPRKVLRENKAHCMEGALLAATIFRILGEEPLLLDLEATQKDFDHIICLFKRNGKWGSISKTNHAVLRYREPIYKNIRELVMSFFHEYFDDDGKKNLRSYSMPVNLKRFDSLNWVISEGNVWEIPEYFSEVKHYPLLTRSQIKSLRKADDIEIDAGKILEWKKS